MLLVNKSSAAWHQTFKCKCSGCKQSRERYITKYGVQEKTLRPQDRPVKNYGTHLETST